MHRSFRNHIQLHCSLDEIIELIDNIVNYINNINNIIHNINN